MRVIQSDGSVSEHQWPLAEKGVGLPTAVVALVDKAETVRGWVGVRWVSRLNWCSNVHTYVGVSLYDWAHSSISIPAQLHTDCS